MWSGKLPAIIAALALGCRGMVASCRDAARPPCSAGCHRACWPFPPTCEVPDLWPHSMCRVFQHAVAGGLVAAMIATYALTWFCWRWGLPSSFPSCPRDVRKSRGDTALAGGAARLAPLAGRPKYPTLSLPAKEG
ncbi:MAG: hypothetical protein ACLU37_07365 [Collinsella sp.]